MRIKLAIIERDQDYLNRIVSALEANYSDKLEVYSYTDPDVAMLTLEALKIHILLAGDTMKIDFHSIPADCGFAYLVDDPGTDTFNRRRAICRYQRAELIYKQIAGLYSEMGDHAPANMVESDRTKILVFTSPVGGVGTSTLAVACALQTASWKRTLYLNLEPMGPAYDYFMARSSHHMGEVIASLKDKGSNLALTLEDCVSVDRSGVCFFAPAASAKDYFDLTVEDAGRLLRELKISGVYDYIVVDLGFSASRAFLEILHRAHGVVLVGDGSEVSNHRILQAYDGLTAVAREMELPIRTKLYTASNRVQGFHGGTLHELDGKLLGTVPYYDGAEPYEIVSAIAGMDIFRSLY